MSWRIAAIGLGRLMRRLARGQRPRAGHPPTLLAAATLLLPLAASAAETESDAPFFAAGLSPRSSWEEILKRPGIQVEFPYVGFGNAFVPLSAVCSVGDALAIADPSRDKGVRVSMAPAARPSSAGAAGRFAATPPLPARSGPRMATDAPGGEPPARVQYDLNVYRSLPGLNPQRVLLFQKPWAIPACGAR